MLLLAAFQLPFVVNLLLLLCKPRETDLNPWAATTLEWARPPPDPAADSIVYRQPCAYSLHADTFVPQWKPTSLAPHDIAPKTPTARPQKPE